MTRMRKTTERLPPGDSQRHGQPMSSAPKAESITQREASFFHLLAHPARLELLDALRYDSACVCHLEALLGFPQAYISQQLAVLRAAGLIEGRREGWNVYYHVCDGRLFAVLDAARALHSPADLASPTQSVKREPGDAVPGCACPHCVTASEGAAKTS